LIEYPAGVSAEVKHKGGHTATVKLDHCRFEFGRRRVAEALREIDVTYAVPHDKEIRQSGLKNSVSTECDRLGLTGRGAFDRQPHGSTPRAADAITYLLRHGAADRDTVDSDDPVAVLELSSRGG
jgi:hypothetical protein